MIYINARFLTQPITGVQRFAIELCKQLKRSNYAEQFQLVSPFNVLHITIAEELGAKCIGRNEGHLWEQYDLPKYLKQQGNPLLINLANAAPVLYRRCIVTIHDLSIYQNAAWFSFTYRYFYKTITPVILKNALKVLTVSESVKEELIHRFSLSSERVHVIYNGISDLFLYQAPATEKENYLLTVSSIDPRKNLKTLIKAFNKAAIKDYKLYIIGGKAAAFSGTDFDDEIQNNSNIKFLGRVSDEDLVMLYAKSKLFAYLSLYEGFGIPNVEAMAMGVPVITSDISSIREVCGDAAKYVNPLDVAEAAGEIKMLLDNAQELENYSMRGRERSKLYRWEYAAGKLIKILFHE